MALNKARDIQLQVGGNRSPNKVEGASTQVHVINEVNITVGPTDSVQLYKYMN